MRRILSVSIVAVLIAGCAGTRRPPDPHEGLVPALPFIEDDFEGAMARAKETGRPLFVEVWAPW